MNPSADNQANAQTNVRRGSLIAWHLRLALKELRETLRDRRTIATLVLMPILVYPLLSMAFQRFLLASVRQDQQEILLVAVPDRGVKEMLENFLQTWPLKDDSSQPMAVEFHIVPNVTDAVAGGHMMIGIGWFFDEERIPVVDVVYRDDLESRYFAREMESHLLVTNVDVLQIRLRENRLPHQPPAYVHRHLIQADASGPSPLATIVPLILILMTITGAVYPAIDLTAGERERGTLETLIAAPVSRLSLLVAKYIAVVTVALLTASVNLLAMTITIQLAGLGILLFGQNGLSLATILLVFGLLVLFAAFFSAMLLSITAFARSFKEAQAYLIPLMLMAIAPGLLSMTPGVELTPLLAAVPLVNMVLVARDIFLGGVDMRLAVVAVATTIFYAATALGFAARIFGADAILYGSHRSWSDLWERPQRWRADLPIGAAVACLAVLFPAQFVLGGVIRHLPLTMRLVAAGLATAVLFVGVPWLGARFHQARFLTTFRIHRPALLAWPAAILLGVSLWPLAHYAFQWGAQIGLANLSNRQLAQVSETLHQLRRLPTWLIVVCVGIIPGICEELFFRGVLFQSLRKAMSGYATILLSALLFALFHLVDPSFLTTERFLPSLLLGLVLGWVAYRSDSVLPAVIVHAVHNGLLLGMSPQYQSQQAPTVQSVLNAKLPPSWTMAAVLGATCGLAILLAVRPRAGRRLAV